MKKYFHIYKTTLLDSLQYISNIFSGFISLGIVMLVFISLWKYLYSDSSNLIEGYSYVQMIWYVLMTECIWYGAKSKTLLKGITDDIKSGTIAYNLNKPYSYVGYIIAKYLGEITIKFIISVIVCFTFGLIFIGKIPNFDFKTIPLIALVLLLAVIINAIIKITISLFSFFIEDATPMHWIYDKLILVLGTMFPIELYPAFIIGFISYSPIYVVTYGPAKLLVDFNINLFFRIVGLQLIYLLVFSILITLIYRRGGRKLNVNGG